MKKHGYLLTVVVMFFVRIAGAIPSYSDVSGISSSLSNLASWLAYGIGPGCVLISLSIFAFRLMGNDKDAWSHSKNLIIGAGVLELAAGIAKALMNMMQVQGQ